MRWIELSTTADSGSVEKIDSILRCFGHGGTAVEEWQPDNSNEKTFVVKIYLPHSRSYKETRRDIERSLSTLSDSAPIHLREQLLKPEDWLDSLKKHFSVVEIGTRFIIKPSWVSRTLSADGRVVIELDPGAAFGTGLHPTTRLCLLALEKYLKPGMSILDLGTGSGILAIAAVKLGAARVLALDIDPLAVRAARDNTKKNGTEGSVQVRRGTLSTRFQRQNRGSFDLALANITAKAIGDCSSGFASVLKTGGRLVASGIHAGGLDAVLISLALAGFTIESIDREGEWDMVTAVNN